MITTAVESLHGISGDFLIYNKVTSNLNTPFRPPLKNFSGGTAAAAAALASSVQSWLADECDADRLPCADFSNIIIESIVRLSDIIRYSPNLELDVATTDRWCRQMGLAAGTRIMDIDLSHPDLKKQYYIIIFIFQI